MGSSRQGDSGVPYMPLTALPKVNREAKDPCPLGTRDISDYRAAREREAERVGAPNSVALTGSMHRKTKIIKSVILKKRLVFKIFECLFERKQPFEFCDRRFHTKATNMLE